MKQKLTFLSFGLAAVAILALSGWSALALWYRLPFSSVIAAFFAASFGLLGIAVILELTRPKRLRALATFCLALATVLVWWNTLTAPSQRNWSPDVARQVTGQVEGDILHLKDVRNFSWRSPTDFDALWEDRNYNLSKLQSVDLFMSYWSGKTIAHMIISFGFSDGEHLAWSVEVRRQIGGEFSPIADLFKSNTLAIVAADERDLIGTRTNARGEDVQLFRTNTTTEAARALLLQYVAASNQLAARPKWYNSLTTNCTTVVMTMIQTIVDEVPLDWRVLANGYLPEYAWDQGVLGRTHTIEELRRLGSITPRAQVIGITPDYSLKIREGVPLP